MLAIANDRSRTCVVLLIALIAFSGQMFASRCDQPLVSYRAGQLTISSNDCSLQQVLAAVSRETRIEMDIPASANAIPVSVSLGPGDPAHVITELLDGSPLNSSIVIKADGSGEVARVLLTERIAPVESPKSTVAAAPGMVSGDALTATTIPEKDLKKDVQKKQDQSATDVTAFNPNEDDSAQPRIRPAIDESTLKQMPALPPGIPSSMWSLYPGLTQTVLDNNGAFPDVASTSQPAPSTSPTSANSLPSGSSPLDPNYPPKGAIGLPTLPPGIDPAIGKLYPWNLMQLIQTAIALANSLGH